MNFVFVSLQRINTDRDSTSTCLAKELAKTHKVLYVNSPIDRRTLLSSEQDEYTRAHIAAIKAKKPPLSQIKPNLWVLNPTQVIESINWIPFTSVFSSFNRLNNQRFAKDIRDALNRLGFDHFILINDKDIFRSFYLKELLKPDKYVYLDRDYTVGMDYWKRHGAELEPKLMAKADAVVCNSFDFTKRAQRYNPNSFYIGNGFDVKQYDSSKSKKKPTELQHLTGPVIGYVGALITLRLDLNLMLEMAKAKPQWNFVLIGWEDAPFQQSELHRLPNVLFLGKKHTSEVPAYLEHFDVCINPQLLNEITRGNFPLKVVEYLALGKPVVATSTNTMQEIFGQHTYLATDPASFFAQIEKALEEDNAAERERRIQFAGNFSWENVANTLLECILPAKAAQPAAALSLIP
ncbi:glycosyltransferase [Rufibacter immobilis]|uniref:glycosyltransferase n=1 Tax=Rufibacter immobilis TaxID=1348778 RepID=UPI0035E49397